MLKNYFIVALRNFWRHKIFSIIHITGLSVGISASLVIFLIVKYELSFDKFQPDGDRIYRVVMDMSFNGVGGHSAAVPAPLASAIKEEVSGVAATVPVMQFQGDALVDVSVLPANNTKPVVFKKQSEVVFTNSEYFELLPFEWIVGSKTEALNLPFAVVLTESRARTYFPGIQLSDITGKEIVYNKDLRVLVTGVVKDLNEISDLTSREFISYATIAKTGLQDNFMMNIWNDWMAYSKTYVKLNESNDKPGVERQLNDLLKKYSKDASHDPKNAKAFALQPLKDIHFNFNYSGFGQRTANKSTLYGLVAIATFLLVLGCINFINLSTAQATIRAKEIGIRKTIGSLKKQLIVQFLLETSCITTMATVVSVSMTPFLLQVFADFIPAGLSFDLVQDPSVWLFLTVLTVIVSLFSGFYPALVLSGLKPVMTLKNILVTGSTRSSSLRKVLTVSQFMIAQFFIIAGFMVSKQIHYSLNKDLGYRKEAILNFEIPRDTVADHRQHLLNSISQLSGVQLVSTGFLPPAMEGGAYSNMSYNNGKEEIKVPVQIRWGDPNYLRLYNISILAGRNIREGENIQEILVNESYAKALGFQDPVEAIGKELNTSDSRISVVGIMQDFHEGSLRMPIGPLAFKASSTGNFFHVALSPDNSEWQEVIHEITLAFREIYPEQELEIRFFDDTIARFYLREQSTSKLLKWAMGLSLLISCLGLVGLVIYTSETRRKEIGIRKILGASVRTIVSILSLEFIQLVIVAFVLAAPVAWFAVDKWLEGYAYKTSISWWIFVLSGLFLVVVAMLTLSFQTIKTARSNPVSSLRSE